MGAFVRGALVVIGVLLMFGGLVLIVSGSALALAGLELVAIGAFLVVVIAIERQRYRSEAAEQTHAMPGPGGGEPADGPLEPRFRPTAEVFIDPTSGRRMRVVVDPASGERRYVAEG
ncbi:MAG TPA: hypothetical protein VL749_11145 [Patescibacteria group bacterium]|jgi:hypothetical protein|nr:hypothetical protein [Patescibacteria group bacterium]